MGSPLSPSGDASDATMRLAAAREQLRAALAGAAASFPGAGAGWDPPRPPLRPFLTRGTVAAPQYRVFRHDGLGLHFVLRDIEALPQHTSVFGPAGPDGAPVTFAEAVAYAHRAFAVWSREHLLPEVAKNTNTPVEEVAATADRLVGLYRSPAPGG